MAARANNVESTKGAGFRRAEREGGAAVTALDFQAWLVIAAIGAVSLNRWQETRNSYRALQAGLQVNSSAGGQAADRLEAE
jgi:hypothetical protein